MPISQPELERLRAQIRDVVIAVLRKREAAPTSPPTGKSVIVLFTSDQLPGDDFFAQISSLASQGYRTVAALSHSFTQFHGTSVMDRLPKGAGLLQADSEIQHRNAMLTADALLAPLLSSNTAAKIALGIEDSLPSRLVRGMLATGKPVCIGTDLPGHRQMLLDHTPGAPPAIVRVAEDHLHSVQQMGVRFASGNLAGCLTDILRPEVNETPERLARQKSPAKREFVTAEDVWNAMSRGQKELLYGRGAVITDEAHEYAASRGIALKER